MIGEAAQFYGTLDPAKKDYVWANSQVTNFRRFWYPVVSPDRIRINKQYLYGTQCLDQIRDSFKDKKFRECTQWSSLGFMETIKNALVEEILKMPPAVEVRAEDPTAINEKKKDILLLKARKIYEQDVAGLNAEIGLPPQKLPTDKFQSNVEEFDDMGLDEGDQDDVNFYQTNFQRLLYEIAAQSVLNNVIKLNRFDEEIIPAIIDDILAVKLYCVQKYVDQITGEIKFKYLYPETCYGIFGVANDGRDDVVRGWQDSVTVMEWLQMAGNCFDIEKDWYKLLSAINYYPSGLKYTGFKIGNRTYSIWGDPVRMSENNYTADVPNDIEWAMAYRYKVYIGYSEWCSPELTGNWLKSKKDPNFVRQISVDYDLKDKKQEDEYYTESYYQNQWYKTYFLATSSATQYIYDFSKVYYQNLEGANDEYAAGTMLFYREKGNSVIDISKQLIDIGNWGFFKMKWAIYKAKPEEDVYVYEELLEIAKTLKQEYPQMAGGGVVPNLENIIGQAIQYQQENIVRLRSYPRIDGKKIAQMPSLEGKKNGLDPVALAMQSIVSWVQQQIAFQTGINAMRLGAPPPPRESYATEQQTLNSSYNSTGYVYRMVQKAKNRLATLTLNTIQDIVQYEDSIPYKWILKLIGDKNVEIIKLLKKSVPHRLGVYVQDYNYKVEKQRVMQAADIAISQKVINYNQWFAVTHTEDYKRSSQLLAHLELKKEKRLRQQAIEDMKMKQQFQEQGYNQQKDLLMTKGGIENQGKDMQAKAQIASAQIAAQSKKDVKQIQVASEPDKQQQKTEGEKEVLATKSNLENQQPYETGVI